jgi:heptosyltransferase-2
MRCSTAPWSRKKAIPSIDPAGSAAAETSPILIVPYLWIGDFVRMHSVVRVLNARFPDRPVDMLATALTAELVPHMPGVRRAIVCDLPRGRLPVRRHLELGRRLRAERYGTAFVMPRTWKSALAPFLAGIPHRIGFFGEARIALINDVRWGEHKLTRMVDRCGALALGKGEAVPAAWPLPQLTVDAAEVAAFREQYRLTASGAIVALCPGAIGRGKRWPVARFADLARNLADDGVTLWVLGGPNETALAQEIAGVASTRTRDMTGPGLRASLLALKAADVAVANDSGLMHVAAALGAPTIGLFGPTDPRLWGPLNPLAAAIEPLGGSRNIANIAAGQVLAAVKARLAQR